MAKVSTPIARADIYRYGLRTENKNNKSGYSLDHSKPRDDKDKVIVKKGQKYYTWTMYWQKRSMQLTAPTRQQLTGSAFLCSVYDIEDQLSGLNDDCYKDVDEITDAVEDIVSQIRELADEQEEKRSNMPDHLQDCGSGEILQNRYDFLLDWVDNIFNIRIAFDIDEYLEDQEKIDDWKNYCDRVLGEITSCTYEGE